MRSRTAVSALVIAFSVVAGLLNPRPALAETICNGTVQASTIVGDVVVPAGSSCSLVEGTVVYGNVLVRGGSLSINRSTVEGYVYAEEGHVALRNARITGALTVRNASAAVLGGDIGGTVLLEALLPAPGLVLSGLLTAHVAGDAILRGMPATVRPFDISSSLIDGSLAVQGNQAPVEIDFNSIGGMLVCDGNVPPPIGQNNGASLGKFGQCASL